MSANTPFGRRTFLSGALLSAAGLAGVGSLAGCTTVTRSTDIKAINKAVALPDYVRWKGPKPDLPTVNPLMPDAYYRYPATTKVLSGHPGDGSRLQGTVPTNTPVPPSLDRNQYWKALNGRLGLDLGLSITPGGDYPNKFQTALAGDQLGDVWNIFGAPPYLPQLLQAKAQDLTEYLSGDAIRRYPFLANLPTEAWRGCVFAGGIYAVPVARGIIGTNVLLSRQDLFEERGVDMTFKNVDELQSLAGQMTDERSNKWAFAAVPNLVLSAMLGLPNTWQEKGGRFTSENELDAHKDMLEIGRRMTSKGLVHPDSVSAPNAKVWFNQGSAAMTQDTYTALPGFYQQNVAGKAFTIGIPTIPGPDGKQGNVWLPNPNNSITAVSKASPDRIRMILDALNWFAAPFGSKEYTFRKYGVEGHDFDFSNGEPVLTTTGNSETGLGAFPIEYIVDSPIPIYYSGHPDGTDSVYRNMLAMQPHAIQNPTYGLYSPTNSTKGSLLSTVLSNATNDIYLGRKPVSSWDSVVSQWRKGGGDAIRSEYERAFEAKN
ncbi:lipoprotein [Frondihabitans sucicola]|uniref:Lipoprotein n=1 Tax=Frondihabitans sucicola TaxID=1268041 RepID=A0ABN6XXX8_9MICO|nr:extracellular solute-binding protein [Frondihabitans sucicola]BDZ48515.1 lipoprotein [Frondihabitans sucicola]